jgi:hypothetical protein
VGTETSPTTTIGTASVAVDAPVDKDGFSPISQSTGFKTTPFHLATATNPMASTTAQRALGDYNYSESSDEEKSQPLLPDRLATITTFDKNPATLLETMSKIYKSKHQCNLSFLKERDDIQKIGRRASTLMESTQMVAESMTASTKVFTARQDEMDENLAAIKRLLEESMASSSKLAEDVQLLSVQVVSHNDQRHRQGQAAFHRVQDVENLVADFKGASATVTRTLEELVSTSLPQAGS